MISTPAAPHALDDLAETHQLAWFDALLTAAAIRSGCRIHQHHQDLPLRMRASSSSVLRHARSRACHSVPNYDCSIVVIQAMRSTITARGQTVVPAPIRERFQLGPSTRLEWIVDDDGTIRLCADRSQRPPAGG